MACGAGTVGKPTGRLRTKSQSPQTIAETPRSQHACRSCAICCHFLRLDSRLSSSIALSKITARGRSYSIASRTPSKSSEERNNRERLALRPARSAHVRASSGSVANPTINTSGCTPASSTSASITFAAAARANVNAGAPRTNESPGGIPPSVKSQGSNPDALIGRIWGTESRGTLSRLVRGADAVRVRISISS